MKRAEQYVKACLDTLSQGQVLTPKPSPGNAKDKRTIRAIGIAYIELGGPTPNSGPMSAILVKGLIAHYDWEGKPARTEGRSPKERVSQTLLWTELQNLTSRVKAVEEAVFRGPEPHDP